MKHILPFKQKQIEQRQLEAEADKVARIRTAEGAAEARRIEAKGEADSRQKLADAEAYRLDLVGKANAGQMEREGALDRALPAADPEDTRRQALRQGAGDHRPAARGRAVHRLEPPRRPELGEPPVDAPAAATSTRELPVILALAATLAIVVQDHAALRSAPRSSATELTRALAGRCARGPRRACRIPEGLRLSSRAGRLLARARRPGRSSLRDRRARSFSRCCAFCARARVRGARHQLRRGVSQGRASARAHRRALRCHRPTWPSGWPIEASGSSSSSPTSLAHLEVVGTVRRSHAQLRAQRAHASVLRRRVVSSRARRCPERQPRSVRAQFSASRAPECIDPDLGPHPACIRSIDEARALLDRIDEQRIERDDAKSPARAARRRSGSSLLPSTQRATRRAAAAAGAARTRRASRRASRMISAMTAGSSTSMPWCASAPSAGPPWYPQARTDPLTLTALAG